MPATLRTLKGVCFSSADLVTWTPTTTIFSYHSRANKIKAASASTAHQPVSRLVWFTGPEPFKEGKNSWIHLRRNLVTIPKSFDVSLLPILCQRDLWPLPGQLYLGGGGGDNQTHGTYWTLVKQALAVGDTRKHRGLETCGGQAIKGALTEV